MDEQIRTALAVLEDAFKRSRAEDIGTSEVLAALDFVESRLNPKWPVTQFRDALEPVGSLDWQIEGCWQILNASLNGIKLAASKGGR